MVLLTYSMKSIPYLLPSSRPFNVMHIPTRNKSTVRALVFLPPSRTPDRLSPLHLDIHSGVFLGGLAEYDAPFCTALAARTGAVVISTQYRCAPRYRYPAAHEDIEDVVNYLLSNAKNLWKADRELFTVSGFSAGANLVLGCSLPLPNGTVKAFTGFYTPVDLRLSPWEKPKPPQFPKKDPMAILLPLFDSYVAEQRHKCLDDPRMNPILAELDSLPKNMLFVVAGIDILVDEQMKLVERLEREVKERELEKERRVRKIVFPTGFHGWLECKSASVIGYLRSTDTLVQCLHSLLKSKPGEMLLMLPLVLCRRYIGSMGGMSTLCSTIYEVYLYILDDLYSIQSFTYYQSSNTYTCLR